VVFDGPVAEEAFAVIREAMRRTNRMAVGRVVMSARERLVTLAGRDKGFALFTLHSARAVRKADSVFGEVRDVTVNPDEIAVAEQLIRSKTAPLDPDSFVDRYQEELRKIIEAKLQGTAPQVVAEREPGKVIDLMDALKRSLMSEPPPPSVPTPPSPPPSPPAEPPRLRSTRKRGHNAGRTEE
jgi:DNA end-binding protein Ku